MTQNPAFLRKVTYLCIIAALLLPISWLSSPATSQRADGTSDRGGQLSQLRTTYGLSQAELGEIDPASSTMQLATLGLRGPAATLLWNRAIEFQKKERWDSLSATLNQIAKIQPHMIAVWKYQAWNMAYNVSVEFDDYHMRYHWVKKGVDFMLKGTRYNAQSPKLLNDLGWFFSHKFGRSDEALQFRREFKIDKDFHKTLPFSVKEWDDVRTRSPDELPDNWLVSWLWHLRAEEAALTTNRRNLAGSPLVFYSKAPMSLMYFAQAIEGDGVQAERASMAWRQAGEAWESYGNTSLPTTLGDRIQLNNLENLNNQIARLEEELKSLAPGAEEELQADLKSNLEPEEREALETLRSDRTADQYELAAQAERALEYTPRDVALRAPAQDRERALVVAGLLMQKKIEALYTNRYRQQINYDYWLTRSEIEQTENAVKARREVYDAEILYSQAKLDEARASYELAWARWAKIFAEHPEMLEDTTAEDLMESVQKYSRVLAQLEVSFPPEDFPLMDLLRAQDPNFAVPPSTETESEDSATETQATDSESSDVEGTEPDETPSVDTPPEDPASEATPAEGTSSAATDSQSPAVDEEDTSSETPPAAEDEATHESPVETGEAATTPETSEPAESTEPAANETSEGEVPTTPEAESAAEPAAPAAAS